MIRVGGVTECARSLAPHTNLGCRKSEQPLAKIDSALQLSSHSGVAGEGCRANDRRRHWRADGVAKGKACARCHATLEGGHSERTLTWHEREAFRYFILKVLNTGKLLKH